MHTEKQRLRGEAIAARAGLAAGEAAAKMAAIHARLRKEHEVAQARVLLCYGMGKGNEVECLPLMLERWAKGLSVWLPRALGNGALEWVEMRENRLVKTRMGIFEPTPHLVASAAPMEGVCLVPCLLFTSAGHRLGYGGSYYDRFLAGFKGKCIALGYELQRRESLPVEAHDARVGYIVTEDRTYDAGAII